MESGRAGVPTSASLVCTAGGRRCALPVGHVIETMRPLPVELVVGVPDFVAGLALIRGAPTPVVDLGRLLGATAAAPWGRFVVVAAGGRRVALAVDAVLGVRALDAAALEALPPLVEDAAGPIAALAALDGELLVVIRGARLVPEAALEALSRAGR
ncbi:MAG: chemotaxis protein CheW [Myxococcales bacterium]|nr:chemotaxis protein CheW [Myxococcales bacterium]